MWGQPPSAVRRPKPGCRSGVCTDARNRLAMVTQCAAHMQHHIGQMIYLNYAWASQRSK
jgi:hypothetical protein